MSNSHRVKRDAIIAFLLLVAVIVVLFYFLFSVFDTQPNRRVPHGGFSPATIQSEVPVPIPAEGVVEEEVIYLDGGSFREDASLDGSAPTP